MQQKSETRGRERLASALILLVLVGIAASLVLRQLRRSGVEPGAEALPSVTPEPAPDPIPASDPASLAALLPGWQGAGTLERYGPDRLFEKINGQADLYLDAGFEGLEAQRLRDPRDPARSVELRLYTMTSPEAAASVRARQQRPGGEAPAAGVDGQCLEGACFLAHGPFYLEVIPTPPGEPMAATSREAALAFVETHPVASAAEEGLFPPDGLVAGSVALGVPNAFGSTVLERVDTASYRLDGREVSVWLVRHEKPGALLEGYRAELLALGGHPTPDGKEVEIMGTYCVLRAGRGVALGVQEAPELAAAVALADRLVAAIEVRE